MGYMHDCLPLDKWDLPLDMRDLPLDKWDLPLDTRDLPLDKWDLPLDMWDLPCCCSMLQHAAGAVGGGYGTVGAVGLWHCRTL